MFDQPIPNARSLDDGEAHVWLAHLNVCSAERTELARALDATELHRAQRYRFCADREHFLVRRGLLRALVGSYLAVRPASIRFSAGCHGKPKLGPAFDGSGIHFNVSHSTGWALYAIARNRSVGVDIESMNPARADPAIAARFFATGEQADLRTLSGADWVTGFFNCWTRKEAYIKATGKGLSYPLDAFEVSLLPGVPARLVRVNESPRKSARWEMVDLYGLPGYAAALAAEKPLSSLRFWRWQPGGAQPRGATVECVSQTWNRCLWNALSEDWHQSTPARRP